MTDFENTKDTVLVIFLIMTILFTPIAILGLYSQYDYSQYIQKDLYPRLTCEQIVDIKNNSTYQTDHKILDQMYYSCLDKILQEKLKHWQKQ